MHHDGFILFLFFFEKGLWFHFISCIYNSGFICTNDEGVRDSYLFKTYVYETMRLV